MKTQKTDSAQPDRPARDPDFIGAEAAMQRAADRAWERAAKHGGSVAVYDNGKVVWVKADAEALARRKRNREAQKERK